jgi:hypothetical protein
MMSGAQLEVVIVLPFLLLAVALVVAFAWAPEAGEDSAQRSSSRRPRARIAAILGLVGSWFVLTTLTIWCGAILAFLLLHGLLFTLGSGAASVGLFLTVILLEIAPFAWGVVMVRRARRPRSRDGGGRAGPNH